MLMANKQSYVTVMINKRRYSSEIAMFDTSTDYSHSSQHIQDHDTTRWCYC